MKIEQNKQIKIDIVSPPFSGHLHPILELIKPLIHNENYKIRIFTGENKKKFLENLNIECKVILEDQPTIFEEIANTSKQTNVFDSYIQLKKNIRILPLIKNELKEEFSKNRPDIVIADFVAVPAGLACNDLGIPWITSLPTPFVIESKTTTPTYLGGWYPKDNFFYKTRDFLGRKFVRFFKKFVCFLGREELKPLNFKLYDKNNLETIYSPYSILALGMKEIEFRDDFPDVLKWVGPCNLSYNNDYFEMIDTSNFSKTIFITIGTHLLWGKDKIISLIKELSEKYPNICFIFSLGDYSKKDEKVEKILKNMFIYHYIDYDTIIPNVDFVIHHGGAGVFYNCIKFNKPAVIIPHDYDQFDFAVRADIAQIGIPASLKSKKSIFDAVEKLINKKDWNNLQNLHKRFYEYNPGEVLEKEIERLLDKNK